MATKKKPPVETKYSYRAIPPLADYIDRVGAEQLNFRRFMVKEYRSHYYIEKTVIKLFPDGSISCSAKEHSPTKEEAEAIKGYFAANKIEWPKAILAPTIARLKPLILHPESTLYELWSRKEEGIIMVQERRPMDTGERNKEYYPWTFFSDGKWRCMEPDGDLPFWKPKKKRGPGIARIMIHEGAKAAKICDELVNDPGKKKELEAHPWGKDLAQYEHWGLIGGALAPHRADYSEIFREKPIETIYVADNDYNGKQAPQKVSKCYGRSLKVLYFDDKFGESFDLADPFPPNLFRNGRYIGPSFFSLLKPATWATQAIPGEGKGRPTLALRDDFKKEWLHSIIPEAFVNVNWPDEVWDASNFNSKVDPFSDSTETSRLLKKDDGSKAHALEYDPAKKKGVYVDGTGGRKINTHVPSDIKEEKGNPKPFLDFMEQLVPDKKDRTELMRWCATLIAKPEVRMAYGVLLISETQGVGKSTLGASILAPLMGEKNVSYPSEKEIVESQFNYWLAHKRLAIIHEIYAGHSAKAYNALKSVITEKDVTVSKKYQANYLIRNWIHVFACSNSLRAIQLSMDDRRWFVPKLTEEKWAKKYWDDFNDWLQWHGGLGIVKWWASDFLKKEASVAVGEAAPWSLLKKEIIEEGFSPGQTLIAQFLDATKEEMNGTPFFLLDTDLVALVKDNLYEGRHSDRLEKPATLRKIARNRGWFVSEKRANIKEWGCLGVGARLLSPQKSIVEASPENLAKSGKKPLQVLEAQKKRGVF